MWSRLQAALHRQGIDLTKIPLTMDAWLVAPSLRHRLHALGFTKIIMAGKSHYPFPIDGKKQEASPGKQALVRHDPTWGIDVPSCRVHAQSPTFGALLLYRLNNRGHILDVFQEAPRLRLFARS